MKTLEQIKNEYAVSKGCKDWKQFIDLNLAAHEYHYNCIIEIVQKECLKRASENFIGASKFAVDTRDSITNENNIIK